MTGDKRRHHRTAPDMDRHKGTQPDRQREHHACRPREVPTDAPSQQVRIKRQHRTHRRRGRPFHERDKTRQHQQQPEHMQRQPQREQQHTARHRRDGHRQHKNQHRKEQDETEKRSSPRDRFGLILLLGQRVQRLDAHRMSARPNQTDRSHQRHTDQRRDRRHPSHDHARRKRIRCPGDKCRENHPSRRESDNPARERNNRALQHHHLRHLFRRHTGRAQQGQYTPLLLDANGQGIDQHAERRQDREREQQRCLPLEVL